MAADNNVLMALAVLERVEPQLNVDTRSQIDRNSLIAVQHYIMQAQQKLIGINLRHCEIRTNLVEADNLIMEILSDDAFEMTDLETKELLISKIETALHLLYLDAGMYYDTEHEFAYSMRLNTLLQRIINVCVSKGYYFGQY